AGSVSAGGVRLFFFFASRRRHTRCYRDWSSDVCSSDLVSSVTSTASGSGPAKALDVPATSESSTSWRPASRSRRGGLPGASSREIGRASCRERGGSEGGTGTIERESARTTEQDSS